jgi:uncharacterized membrane protein
MSIRLPTKLSQLRAPAWLQGFIQSLSTPGILLATLFFAASLTPSLVPRPFVLQGILSGLSLAAGYGLGVGLQALWDYLGLPRSNGRLHRTFVMLAGAVCLIIAMVFLYQAAGWQNSIRVVMDMERVDSAQPWRVGALALTVFAIALALGRLFQLVFRQVAGRLRRFIPHRVANVAGVVVALLLFGAIVDGILVRYALIAADRAAQQADLLIEADVEQPADSNMTGSAASLVSWQDLGRQGRRFVSRTPSAEAISAFVDRDTQEPRRIYVGLNADDTIEGRAQKALAELKRVDAFDRSLLVVATPTGKGWIDDGAIAPLEYLHGGDIATVGVQYSYLPSWLSLMAEAEYGADTAEAVFRTVYDHWSNLPADDRPALYLYGLSLGALNSERAVNLYDIITDPFSGALWSGPPFRSERWRDMTNQRRPGTPAWLPRFRGGSVVRFTNQNNHLEAGDTDWGPLRIAYLQYASDPVTFFDPSILYREPEWMRPPRGPDVSDELRWYPVVTMLQLAIDILAGDQAPMGHGHVYAPEHYIDAWIAITEPEGWTAARIDRLKRFQRERREQQIGERAGTP